MLVNTILTVITIMSLAVPLLYIMKILYFNFLKEKDEREHRRKMYKIKEEREYERS